MTMQYPTKLDEYLHKYSIMLDYWNADEGDSHLMLDYRELIDEHLTSASAEQRKKLAELDAKAAALLDGYLGAETWDIKMLRETVKLIREHLEAA